MHTYLKIDTTSWSRVWSCVEIFLIDWIFLLLMLIAHQFVLRCIDSSGKPWEWYLLWVSINQRIFCPFAIDRRRVSDEINQINYQNYRASVRRGQWYIANGKNKCLSYDMVFFICWYENIEESQKFVIIWACHLIKKRAWTRQSPPTYHFLLHSISFNSYSISLFTQDWSWL